PVWTVVLMGARPARRGRPGALRGGPRAAAGRLRRNRWVGVRTPATLAGDTGWRTGHAAARPWAAVAGRAARAVRARRPRGGRDHRRAGSLRRRRRGGRGARGRGAGGGAVRADAAARGSLSR
ncbi:MAG: hypothetical protein PGN11_00450, partial [Quadrisphaera sp.]